MALVRSTLNPNAPLFIPPALRKVEDFSPEWWQLVTNSTWYRNYWHSLNPDGFDDHANKNLRGDGVVYFLPDNFDVDDNEDFSAMEAQYEEFLQFSENGEGKISPSATYGMIGAVQQIDESKQSIVKSLNVDGRGQKVVDPAKYAEKPTKNVNSKYSRRCIQQPR